MKNLFTILKTNFINTSGVNKILKQKKSKLILYGFLFFLLAAYLLFTTGTYSVILADFLGKYNLMNFMLPLFFIVASFSTFMFTISSSKGNLFNANDNDMLLSMPIKTSTILASRIINMIIWNLITALFIMGPAIVIYAVKVNVPPTYYLFIILIFLFITIIPTVLASLVGYFIAFLTSKTNSKNWFEIIMSFILIFLIITIMGNGEKILNFIANSPDKLEAILKWGFYPIYLVNKALATYDYSSLFIFLIINIGFLSLFVLILRKSFKKIIAKLQENKTKSNYVITSLNTSSINKTLIIKEIKRYISSPIYVLNTCFGVVLMFGLSIASIFYDKDQIMKTLGYSTASLSPFQLALALTAFVVFLSNAASISISLEGKNFWILKSLPIDPKRVLNSKLILNLAIVLPVVFISIIILKFTFLLSIVEMLVLMITALISSLVAYQFGLLINLKFPKMDANNDTVLVKRSASVMVSMMVPLVIMFIIIGIYTELTKIINFNLFIFLILILFIIIIIIERMLLNKWGIKRYNQIN
ncbi:MAG: hypothetical protein PHQ89_03030 [Bacilli bacterium]|nr:hypothetical protein [Bacilli bacterium]